MSGHRPDVPGLVAAQTALGVKLLEEQRELKRQLEAANASAERWRLLAAEEKARADKWTEAHGALVIEAGMRHEKDQARISELEEQLRFAQGELRRLLTGETNGNQANRPSEED